jgi:hypothetical protein
MYVSGRYSKLASPYKIPLCSIEDGHVFLASCTPVLRLRPSRLYYWRNQTPKQMCNLNILKFLYRSCRAVGYRAATDTPRPTRVHIQTIVPNPV